MPFFPLRKWQTLWRLVHWCFFIQRYLSLDKLICFHYIIIFSKVNRRPSLLAILSLTGALMLLSLAVPVDVQGVLLVVNQALFSGLYYLIDVYVIEVWPTEVHCIYHRSFVKTRPKLAYGSSGQDSVLWNIWDRWAKWSFFVTNRQTDKRSSLTGGSNWPCYRYGTWFKTVGQSDHFSWQTDVTHGGIQPTLLPLRNLIWDRWAKWSFFEKKTDVTHRGIQPTF